jgi:hypothetical protein
MPTFKQYLPPKEAISILATVGVDRQTFYRLVRKGKIRKVPKQDAVNRWLYNAKDIYDLAIPLNLNNPISTVDTSRMLLSSFEQIIKSYQVFKPSIVSSFNALNLASSAIQNIISTIPSTGAFNSISSAMRSLTFVIPPIKTFDFANNAIQNIVSYFSSLKSFQTNTLADLLKTSLGNFDNGWLKNSLALYPRPFTKYWTDFQISAFDSADIWPTPSMPSDLIHEVITLYLSGQSKLIPNTILKYFQANGGKAIRSMAEMWWNIPQFQERKAIISSAIEAHLRKEFVLSIRSLLADIQGISLEYVKITNKTSFFDVKTNQTKSVSTRHPDTLLKVLLQDLPENYRVTSRSLTRYLDGILFHKTNFDAENDRQLLKYSSEINRHAIQHGIQIVYEELGSLKMILILDVLHAAFEQLLLISPHYQNTYSIH